MLSQHVASGQHSLIQPGDAAEPESKTAASGSGSNPVHQAKRQRFEHEAKSQRQMQVVEADVDLLQSWSRDPVIKALQRGPGFQQGDDGRTARHHPGEIPHLAGLGEHRQHDLVRPTQQHRIEFFRRRGVQGIDANHERRPLQRLPDATDVRKIMGADERVAPGLSLGLAQPLEVDEQAQTIQGVATAGERRVVGDLDQFNHGVRPELWPGLTRAIRLRPARPTRGPEQHTMQRAPRPGARHGEQEAATRPRRSGAKQPVLTA